MAASLRLEERCLANLGALILHEAQRSKSKFESCLPDDHDGYIRHVVIGYPSAGH
jgi:hypothetical protein